MGDRLIPGPPLLGICPNCQDTFLTLTGMGGSGKTRLALHAAAALAHAFPYGAWFVELAPLDDPVLVPQAVASALGVQAESSQPLPTILTSYLQTKALLLLLDNCEHVVGAAAELAESLLQTCPYLRLLTTSRETLGVPGEMTFRVPPLALPNPTPLPSLDELRQYEAIQLFVERAQAVLPDFRLTADNAAAVFQICRRWTAFPWQLSWQRRVWVYCVLSRSPRVSTTFSTC